MLKSYAYLNKSSFRDSLIYFLISRNQTTTDPPFDTCQIQSIRKESAFHASFSFIVDQLSASASAHSDAAVNPTGIPDPSLTPNEEARPDPQNEKSGKIQFNHPGNGVSVIELRVNGTLQANDVPLFRSATRDQSAKALTFVVHSCNSSHHSSRAFSLYLGIIDDFNTAEEGSVYSRSFDEILLSTTVLGKYGCYFKKDEQWYHLTWYIQGIECDYLTLTQIAKHGDPSSTFPCILCPVEKKLYNPLYGSLLPSTWSQIFDSEMMTAIDSSLNFINPSSLYRMSSIVYQLIIQNEDSFRNQLFKDTRSVSLTNHSEYSHLTSLFSFLDHSYLLMWTPPVLTSLDSLQRALKLTTSIMQRGPYEVSPTDPIKLKQDLTENQLEPPTPPTGEDAHLQAMTLLPKGGIYSIDPIQLYSDAFQQFCTCLNNQLPTYGNTSYYSDFAQLFATVITPSSCTKRPGIVPELVNALAYRRISELGNTSNSWLDPRCVVPSFFNDMTREQRIVLYFCLFTYMYQDSLNIPVVYFMNAAVGIMSELYIMNRDYFHASRLQARLSTYLGLLESNVTPNYATSSTHLPNHLYQSILFFGPLFEQSGSHVDPSDTTDSEDEESAETISSYSEERMVKSLASIFVYPTKTHAILISQLVRSQIALTSSLDYDMWIHYSLIDDYIFSMNTHMPHDSYLDHVISKSELDWEHRYGYLKDKVPKPCRGNTLYSSLTWNGHNHEAILESETETPSIEWLQRNLRHVAFTRGFDDFLHYFVVRGFLVNNVGGNFYPVAVCSQIKVESMSHEYNSYYNLKLAQDWDSNLKNYVVISLYRLTMGTSIMLPFANRKIWGITPMTLKLLPFHEEACDELFVSIRRKIMESKKWNICS